jgi:choline kinase
VGKDIREGKMDYKVCILAAGASSGMGPVTDNINRAILPVNFKAVISRIVEKFDKNLEIVIAIGHKGETIKDYLSLAHPDRNFTFVEVDKYIGPGTGPGYSMLKCKDYLQCPFIFYVADTLVLEEVPEPFENWYGTAPVKETERFCTVKIRNNLIYELNDKVKCDNKFAFMGIAGVKDYEIFFNALEKNNDMIGGEIQVSNGFKGLIEHRLSPKSFTWFDTGTLENYKETNKSFSGGDEKFDFSKGNEFLYFVEDRVIKYFADEEAVRKKVERAEHLKGLCPEMENHKPNFYSYKKIEGQTLYEVLNSQILKDFLYWSKRNLWEEKDLDEEGLKKFREACKSFYYDKTMKRVNDFHEKNGIIDNENDINGVRVPSLKDLFGKINWEEIYNGKPVRFHGDFTVGNILVTRDVESQLQKFVLIDWRHEFGGLMEMGDIYYDLAKLYKGIILSDELIKEGKFSFDISGNSVYYNYVSNSGLMEAKEDYENFINENGFDLDKIKTITAIALLNMSPLHNYPFNFLVYYLGKNMLYKTLTKSDKLNSGGTNDII